MLLILHNSSKNKSINVSFLSPPLPRSCPFHLSFHLSTNSLSFLTLLPWFLPSCPPSCFFPSFSPWLPSPAPLLTWLWRNSCAWGGSWEAALGCEKSMNCCNCCWICCCCWDKVCCSACGWRRRYAKKWRVGGNWKTAGVYILVVYITGKCTSFLSM